jgi:hypothetical protein
VASILLVSKPHQEEGATAMEKLSTESQDPSRITWHHLKEWVRGKVQEFKRAEADLKLRDH